jgi:nucleoside-diphosphate-sugar epimerase
MYGKGDGSRLTEGASLNPVSAYAVSKIMAEKSLAELAGDGFETVALRNATAYGLSPMLRMDLVANHLLAHAVALGELQVKSDGTPWRPLIHCRDIARACLAFAEAPSGSALPFAVNVGGDAENYRVRDVVDHAQRLCPDARVVFTGEAGADPRDYQVDFGLLAQVLPDFRLSYTLESGMEELHRALVDRGFGRDDLDAGRFVRLTVLKERLRLLQGHAGKAGRSAA